MAQARTTELPVSGSEDTGKLLLRVGLGVLILLHGIAKIVRARDDDPLDCRIVVPAPDISSSGR